MTKPSAAVLVTGKALNCKTVFIYRT